MDDRYLFVDSKTPSSYLDAIFLTTEGGEPEMLVDNTVTFTQESWLPDGSGFIYVGRPDALNGSSDNVYYYDLNQ